MPSNKENTILKSKMYNNVVNNSKAKLLQPNNTYVFVNCFYQKVYYLNN